MPVIFEESEFDILGPEIIFECLTTLYGKLCHFFVARGTHRSLDIQIKSLGKIAFDTFPDQRSHHDFTY